MTNAEILNTILGISGATMGRTNKTNFVVIPTDEGFVKVSITSALMQDTKNHKAFNFDAAIAEYKAWEAESALKIAERANKPVKVKGPNPEAQARRDALDAVIANLGSFENFTATDIFSAVKNQVPENTTVMAIGSSAQRLVANGVMTMVIDENKKKRYTKA